MNSILQCWHCKLSVILKNLSFQKGRVKQFSYHLKKKSYYSHPLKWESNGRKKVDTRVYLIYWFPVNIQVLSPIVSVNGSVPFSKCGIAMGLIFQCTVFLPCPSSLLLSWHCLGMPVFMTAPIHLAWPSFTSAFIASYHRVLCVGKCHLKKIIVRTKSCFSCVHTE